MNKLNITAVLGLGLAIVFAANWYPSWSVVYGVEQPLGEEDSQDQIAPNTPNVKCTLVPISPRLTMVIDLVSTLNHELYEAVHDTLEKHNTDRISRLIAPNALKADPTRPPEEILSAYFENLHKVTGVSEITEESEREPITRVEAQMKTQYVAIMARDDARALYTSATEKTARRSLFVDDIVEMMTPQPWRTMNFSVAEAGEVFGLKKGEDFRIDGPDACKTAGGQAPMTN